MPPMIGDDPTINAAADHAERMPCPFTRFHDRPIASVPRTGLDDQHRDRQRQEHEEDDPGDHQQQEAHGDDQAHQKHTGRSRSPSA